MSPHCNADHWFVPPSVSTAAFGIHIGTNDILQNFQTSTMAMRLDQLIGRIVA
jgi:hypothetical protein